MMEILPGLEAAEKGLAMVERLHSETRVLVRIGIQTCGKSPSQEDQRLTEFLQRVVDIKLRRVCSGNWMRSWITRSALASRKAPTDARSVKNLQRATAFHRTDLEALSPGILVA